MGKAPAGALWGTAAAAVPRNPETLVGKVVRDCNSKTVRTPVGGANFWGNIFMVQGWGLQAPPWDGGYTHGGSLQPCASGRGARNRSFSVNI